MAKRNRYRNVGALLSEMRNSPYTRAVTPKRAKKEARARARVIYKPEIRAVGKEIKSSRQRTGQTRDWYGDFRGYLEGAADKVAGGYTSAGSSLGAGNPATGTLATQGANQSAFFNKLAAISKIQQRNEVLSQRGERAQMKLDKRALKRERGSYVTGEMSKAREADRNYFLGLMAASQTGKSRKFEARQAEKGRKFDVANREDEQAHEKNRDRYDTKHGGQDGSKKSPVPAAKIVKFVSSRGSAHQVDANFGDAVDRVRERFPQVDEQQIARILRRWIKNTKRRENKQGGKGKYQPPSAPTVPKPEE